MYIAHIRKACNEGVAVPLKFMYDQYWNLSPLFGCLYKNTSKPSRKYRRFTKRLTGLRDYTHI